VSAPRCSHTPSTNRRAFSVEEAALVVPPIPTMRGTVDSTVSPPGVSSGHQLEPLQAEQLVVELVALGLKVPQALGVGRGLERDPLADRDAAPLQPGDLGRVVREEPD